MRNNKHSGPFRDFLREHGYLLVLTLCVVAAGISGLLFLNRETPAADHTQTQIAGTPEQSTQQTPQQDAAQPADPPSTQTSGEDVTVAAVPQPAAAEPEPFVIRMPVEGDVLQDYAMDHLSYNATTQDWRTHDGIDISAGIGAHVTAAADGIVTAIYEDDDFGTTVAVSHENGYQTRYANLAPEVNVSVGDSIRCGEPLGTIGASARLEVGQEDHLHFSLLCNTTPLNPADYFTW